MTIGIVWVGQRQWDGREHLYIAADSRTRGGYGDRASQKPETSEIVP